LAVAIFDNISDVKFLVTFNEEAKRFEVSDDYPSSNKVINRLPYIPPKPLPDPIPSHAHVADWWDLGYSILALGGNTTNAYDNKYFLAFDTKVYKSVTIGFGSQFEEAAANSATFYADGTSTLGIAGSVAIVTAGQGQPVNYGELLKFTFANPWGSGSRQVWLVDYEYAPVTPVPAFGSLLFMDTYEIFFEDDVIDDADDDDDDEITVPEAFVEDEDSDEDFDEVADIADEEDVDDSDSDDGDIDDGDFDDGDFGDEE